MTEQIYNKLVRDKIPGIIKADSFTPIAHIANDEEFREKLLEKIAEEVDEFKENEDPEELADILEVVYALASLQNISPEDLEKIRAEKAKKRGVFTEKIILEKTL